MSKWTKEYKEMMKGKVKAIIVRKPRIGKFELAKILDIDPNTAYVLRESVLREGREAIEKEVVADEITKYANEIDALCLEAWDIITSNTREIKKKIVDKDGKPVLDEKGNPMFVVHEQEISITAKTRAMALVGRLRQMLIDAKFNAGLFKKDWGNLGLDKIFDEKSQKINDVLAEIRKLRTENADNRVQNRGGTDANASPTGDNGIRESSSDTVS